MGDAVCTTNPAAGRGVSLGLRQAAELVRLLNLSSQDRDYLSVSQQFNSWCTENIRPWYDDHVYWDATLLARLRGEEVDVEGPIPSDVICAAAEVDQSIWRLAGPYMTMQVPPTALRGVEDQARAVLRTGWRPPFAEGPSGQELGAVLAQTTAGPGSSRAVGTGASHLAGARM